MPCAVFAYTHNINGGTDVTCKNIFTCKQATQTLPIDATQLLEWECNPRALVQDVFPGLTAAQREFLMTGMTAEEWDDLFGDKED